MATVADLRAQGLACFTRVDTGAQLTANPMHSAFADIVTALSDKDFVTGHLHFLEEAMWSELRRRIPDPGRFSIGSPPDRAANFAASYTIGPQGQRRAPSKKYRQLLSSVLEKTEAANGFGAVSYAWGVSAEAFLTNLKARRPFKDYSASITYHGEYTHRIQWWIICNYVLPSSGENAKYYEECAYYTCDLTGTNPDRTIYLWDFLFDSASNTTGLTALENAGRNPNNVYTWCREPAYPLLSRFLRYRMTKAATYEARITGSSQANTQAQSDRVAALKIPKGILERAAQRFAGKAFDRLRPEQQTEIVDTFLNLGFTDAEV